MKEGDAETAKYEKEKADRNKAFVGESMHETGEASAAKRDAVAKTLSGPAFPKFHSGGVVPRDGIYELEGGEK